MPMRKYKPERIVTSLREIAVELANGKTTPQACKEAPITAQHRDVVQRTRKSRGNGYCESFTGKLRDKYLNEEIFESLREAQLVISFDSPMPPLPSRLVQKAPGYSAEGAPPLEPRTKVKPNSRTL